MINVVVSNNLERVTLPVDEHDTLKSVLDEQDINYSVGMVSLDGATLKPGDINKTFAEMGVTDKCYLSVIVKAENAAEENGAVTAAEAKVTVAGSVVAIESAFTLEQLAAVKKFRPAALSLYETEDGHKTPVFSIVLAKQGDGSIGANGISYGTRASVKGNAMTVLAIPADVKDAKAWAADQIGVAILKVRQLEAKLSGILAEIKAEQAQVAAAITVM